MITNDKSFSRWTLLFLLFILHCFSLVVPLRGVELLPPGFRPLPLGVHALVGGKVVVKPGEVFDPATIVIRDGLIQGVGKDVVAPPDARIWDMKGLTIYAGFIDPYLMPTATNPPVSTSKTEPIGLTSGIKFFGVPGQETDPGSRGPGSQISTLTPERRVAQSYSSDAKTLESMRELGFTTANVVPAKGILRGTSAFVALSDTEPNRAIMKPDVFQHIAFDTDDRKEGEYPESFMGVVAAVRQSFFDTQHYILDHADYLKKPEGRKRPEFNPALEALTPASEKKMRVAFEPGSVLMADRAARVAGELNLDFVLVSNGQEWRRPDLAKRTGAPFIVPVNFPELPKLPDEDDWEQVSLDEFRAWDWAAENPALLRQQGLDVALTTYGLKEKKDFRKNLRLALDRGLSEADALAALTTIPAKLCGLEKLLGTVETNKLANLTVVDGKGYFDPESKVREVWIDGRNYHAQATKEGEKEAKKEDATEKDKEAKAKAEKEKKVTELKELQKKRVARSPLEGRGSITNPPAVTIHNATIWTCGMQGRLENEDVTMKGDRIVAIGKERIRMISDIVPSLLEMDGRGLHITPGLIDCHNHSMILGNVNEATIPSSAMVRIGDVINSETDNIHWQLAGGVTVANELHGSANPIGGQNQVIKLRDGASPEGLKFEGAPPGIKFALGENVKQSNWGDKNITRFPQTRMGVPTFMANRFIAAQQYLKEMDNKNGSVPPRRDLELEAIGEIIQGKRWIHCHSYRQDEILAFLRTMESFNVKVGTLQHVLEGYKVADEIAKHGAGASTFSDWWAYKFEVYDAIPYNGSLMRDRGVLVSFNSDSSDLARRLNTEAAKAVKYGDTPEEEALKFVTINPAKQLHIDQRVGSLEPGKDADFVVWSGPPLDSRSVVLQTWIDGKKYFDRALDAQRTAALEKERTDLLAKAKKLAKLSGGGGIGGGDGDKGDDSFFRVAIEHKYDGKERHCLDEGGSR
ncbi:MAG: amidohydrolase family protein [Verrucomicrobia bacterium]|nr:amidohydrolase family protein [Verrucomicrobiota bacterium]